MKSQYKMQYGAIDLVKFICAILIVCAHYISEYCEGKINKIIEYTSSLYIIVVPFFFVCAGFLLFSKVLNDKEKRDEIVKRYIMRILKIYLAWSLIYIFFNILKWIRFGIDVKSIVKYIINSICYSTYQTIWFLPALAFGVWFTFIFIKNNRITELFLVAILFYLIGALGVSYSFIIYKGSLKNIIDIYNSIFVSTRNGIFNGFPFITIGYLIAYQQRLKSRKVYMNLLLSLLFGVFFIIEAFLIKFKYNAINANTLIMLVPFIYFFVCLLIQIPVKSNKLLKWMRAISTIIFVCQRIYLSAIPEVFPNGIIFKMLNGNPYISIFILLFNIIITAEIIRLASKKYKLMSYLC